MGEYFNWVNADRQEYLSPYDFDLGSKRSESMSRGNELLKALQDLLNKEWKGNHILFLGDEKNISKETDNPALKLLFEQTKAFRSPGSVSDLVDENYRNVSGWFATAEEAVRSEIRFFLKENESEHNEYGIDRNDPYMGLFLRTGKEFKYTINYTKQVHYAFGETKIRYLDGMESENIDPLPQLMGYGRTTVTGDWVGDIVGVSDGIPNGCTKIEEIWLDW